MGILEAHKESLLWMNFERVTELRLPRQAGRQALDPAARCLNCLVEWLAAEGYEAGTDPSQIYPCPWNGLW